MSGLRRRSRPGGCPVEGHGHAHVKGCRRSAGGCSIYAEIPLLDRVDDRRQVAREIADQTERDEREQR